MTTQTLGSPDAPGPPGAPRDTRSTLRLDPAALYWAVLSVSPVSRRVAQDALRYAFEPHLPAPLDEIEARFLRLQLPAGDAVWIACGIERERLTDILEREEAARGAAIESVRPAGLPEAILASGLLDEELVRAAQVRLSGAALEFRRGEFQSGAARSRARVLAWSSLACAACCSALLTTGLLLGARSHRDEAQRIHAAARQLAASAIAGAQRGQAAPLPASVDPRMALSARLRDAQRSRAASHAAAGLAHERGQSLIALLANWPEEPASRVDELRIDQTSVTIRGAVRGAGDAERLANLLAVAGDGGVEAAAAWTVGAVQTSRAAEGYTLSIVLRLPPATPDRAVASSGTRTAP